MTKKSHEEKTKEAILAIQNAVGQLYRGYYQLRLLKEYEEEYESMESLIRMLSEDKNYLFEKHLKGKEYGLI